MLRRSGGGHLTTAGAQERAALVRAFHRGEVDVSDAELDAALGLAPRHPTGAPFEDDELVRMHPGESLADLPTPYAIARGLFGALPLTERDVVFDLGCGNGRVVLYGAVVSPARLVGIEIVAERAQQARDAAQQLAPALGPHQGRVAIVTGNVLDQDLAPGSVFYMFRPFGEDSEPRVLAMLHAEARRRPITVASCRLPPGRFDPDVFDPVTTGTVNIHRARASSS